MLWVWSSVLWLFWGWTLTNWAWQLDYIHVSGRWQRDIQTSFVTQLWFRGCSPWPFNFIQVSNFQGWWRVLKEPGGTNAIMDLELKEENGQIIDVYSVYSFCCGMKSRLNWLMQEQLKEFGPEMEDSFTRIFQNLHELWSVNLRVQPGHPSEFSPELTFEAKQQSPEKPRSSFTEPQCRIAMRPVIACEEKAMSAHVLWMSLLKSIGSICRFFGKIQSVRFFGVAWARWCVQMRRTSCGGGLLWYDSWLVLQGQGGQTAVWRCQKCTGKTSSVREWSKKQSWIWGKKIKPPKTMKISWSLELFLWLIWNCWIFGRCERLDRGCQGAKISELISSGLQGSDERPYCLSESYSRPKPSRRDAKQLMVFLII